ncbi:hypothetical protein AUCHE_08_04370 [Austwickia chelonae NBRC 105200]|uniref:Uncharacterized protein n=1 Tax=Austwickia chelonae NBRC 105200 TaxID=1184607 RepID=K6W8P4_9MICO|nr:hypothetical protein AUCHE_08_04370 [Austwickia chelonae NBRC 105200]
MTHTANGASETVEFWRGPGRLKENLLVAFTATGNIAVLLAHVPGEAAWENIDAARTLVRQRLDGMELDE